MTKKMSFKFYTGKPSIIEFLTMKDFFVIATFFLSYVIKPKQNVLFPESQIHYQSVY